MTQSIKASCGIDFGTSNSTCAVFNDNGANLVPLEDGKLTLPSAMFFTDDGIIFYGREGIRAYIEGEDGRLMRGLKSVLGTSLMNEKTAINRRYLTFVDILTIYIENLKAKAEAYVGSEVENVVLGRPVHFHDNNPQADEQSQKILEGIARSIGFKNIVFQYEPIAAAFAHEQRIQGEKLGLVVDLGGGTSDFAVVRLSSRKSLTEDRRSDILATTGIRVGGTNIDKSLSMAAFMPYLGLGTTYRSAMDSSKIMTVPPKAYLDLSDWPRINSVQTPLSIRETKDILRYALDPQKVMRLLKLQEAKAGHALLQSVEQTKIDLTVEEDVVRALSNIGLDFEVEVSRTFFEQSIADYIDRISASLDECLMNAQVHSQEVDLIILTGGSSELPIINRLVQRKFPNAQLSKDDKFGSVGLGLAYNAGQIFSKRP